MSHSWSALDRDIVEMADEWRSRRAERQARRSLDPADFERLAKAGFLSVALPQERGGLWSSVAETTRPICAGLRTLAAADPSVALVSSMGQIKMRSSSMYEGLTWLLPSLTMHRLVR